jgi:hypothetical protein
MTNVCCYCKNKIKGKPEYCVPEGFPTNPIHDEKPLCYPCGSQPTPTLDEICQRLDMEFEANSPAPTWPSRSKRGGLHVGVKLGKKVKATP